MENGNSPESQPHVPDQEHKDSQVRVMGSSQCSNDPNHADASIQSCILCHSGPRCSSCFAPSIPVHEPVFQAMDLFVLVNDMRAARRWARPRRTATASNLPIGLEMYAVLRSRIRVLQTQGLYRSSRLSLPLFSNALCAGLLVIFL